MSTLTASHGLSLSEIGLKLIKAYEGYRPVDRTLVNGQRVVGYGHRLYDDSPMRLTKADAEILLKEDLEAFEDMINENVHAPLTQGQFDALVSFAYNIGPKAFLESDTLRALNNGRPLDAANGLDVWRKSTIAGKTYVVDALMRRRTAEKALFLRTSTVPQPATAADLPPVADEVLSLLSTEDALPVFTKSNSAGLVARVPVEKAPVLEDISEDVSEHISDEETGSFTRRRDDGPAGVLMLSEVYEDGAVEVNSEVENEIDLALSHEKALLPETDFTDNSFDNNLDEDNTEHRSIIAEAAADISERLDALIETTRQDQDIDTESWPESLITPVEEPKSNLVAFPQKTLVAPSGDVTSDNKPSDVDGFKDALGKARTADLKATEDANVDLIIDNLLEDDALRVSSVDSASRYIDRNAPAPVIAPESSVGLWAIIVIGFLILGATIAAYILGLFVNFGDWGPSVFLSSLITGSIMVLAGIYYTIRRSFI